MTSLENGRLVHVVLQPRFTCHVAQRLGLGRASPEPATAKLARPEAKPVPGAAAGARAKGGTPC